MIACKIKEIIKSSDTLFVIVSFAYNMLFSHCRVALLKGKIRANGVLLKGTKCNIDGKGNIVVFKERSRIIGCKIIIKGNNCQLIGGEQSVVKNTHFIIEDDDGIIKLGHHFTMESGHIAATEGEKITIGDNCMFSNDIEIRNGDSHPIIEMLTGKRTNWAKSVNIGNHVWLTAHVRILKGSEISSNVIIGNSSVVSGKVDKPYCIYAGNPVKIVKHEVNWEKKRPTAQCRQWRLESAASSCSGLSTTPVQNGKA